MWRAGDDLGQLDDAAYRAGGDQVLQGRDSMIILIMTGDTTAAIAHPRVTLDSIFGRLLY